MKKILIWVCSFILMVFMTACDNNEGPFDVKKENGKLILYSNGKLAKGWVEENVTNYNGVTTKVSEIEYDKGLPTGKFKYYDDDGIMVWNANLKRDGNLFKGTITFSEERNYGEMKGTFAINPNWIVGERASFSFLDFFEKTAVDATYDGNLAKGKYKNKKPDGEWNSYYEDGQIRKKENYKNGELDGVFESYHENGQLGIKENYKNGILDGICEYYDKNGEFPERKEYVDGKEVMYEIYYKNGQLKKKYSGRDFEEYYPNGQLKMIQKYSPEGHYEEKKYYDNGQLYIISTKDKYIVYNKNGELTYEEYRE